MASRIPSRTTALFALVLCLSAAAFGQGPSIFTDFPDYAPGSTVNITGSGFVAGESVSLLVLHVNGNNTGNGHLPWTVSADANGNLSSTWFVDPDDSFGQTFILTADSASSLHAETTFTDHINVDFRQAANNDATSNCLPPGPIAGNVHWLNSILQQSNSIYHEGMVVPQRLVMSEINPTTGDAHTLVFWHDALKNGRHAYDFLASWPQAVTTANTIAAGQGLMYNLVNNQCGCAIGPPSGPPDGLDTICANLHSGLGFVAFADLPDAMGTVGGDNVASRVTAFEGAYGNRQVKIYGNAPFTGTPTCTFTGYTGSNPAANYALNWVSASTQIIVEFGGHLAVTGLAANPLAYSAGAGTISGAPYHFSLGNIDSTSLGNQDNQIKCDELVPTGSIDGTPTVNCNSNYTYTASAAGLSLDATWTITNNTAGASFVGSPNCTNVASCLAQVIAAHCGSFTLHVSLNVNGGTTTVDFPVNVADTTPPTISCPANANVACGASTAPENTGTATGTDGCGAVLISHSDEAGPSTCAGAGIIRTWTATDTCGNATSCVQTITIVDTTAPSITCPQDVAVQCEANIPPVDVNSVNASDNCGQVTVVHVGDVPSGPECLEIIVRTYRATDACGNTATCTQTITVQDTTPPTVVNCPGSVSVECNSQIPQVNTASVSGTDNCFNNVIVTHVGDVDNGGPACNHVITRTYKLADPCGNPSFCVQTITVHDVTAPTITCPPDITLPCGTPTDPSVTGTATATDTCGPIPPVTHSDAVNGQCPQGTTITRTWSATDGCNTATCVQIITLTAGPGQQCVPATVTDLGGECGAPAPILTASPPSISNYLAFRLLNAAPNAQVILAAQAAPLPAPLFLAPPCILWVDPASSVVFDFFATDFNGDWTNRFEIAPGNVALIGLTVRVQAGVITQGGPLGFAQLTNGLLLNFGSCPPFCTSSRLPYSGTGFPGQVFDTNFATVFPAGLDVGFFDLASGPLPPNGLRWSGNAAGAAALKSFLAGAAAPSGPLSNDAIDPLTTLGGGSLALEVATLALNVGFNNAGLLGSGVPGFASQVYYNYPGNPDSMNGFSITQILGRANLALSGQGLPAGYTFDTLAVLVQNINEAYDACTESFWGSKYLFAPTN